MMSRSVRGVARVELAAITSNTRTLAQVASGAAVMAVVKDDAYGHGSLEAAQAALTGGATWLGVASIEEGIELRAGRIDAPILVLLVGASDDLDAALIADLDLTVGSTTALADVTAAVGQTGRTARVHLELDTGMGRGGAPEAQWETLAIAARQAESDGTIRPVGVWSHLACADDSTHPSVRSQLRRFESGLQSMERAGLQPAMRHLANSAAMLAFPETHFDMVRPGLSLFGVAPSDQLGVEADLGLRGAMTFSAPVATTKDVPAGQGVSYGLTYRTESATRLALVPIGYSDGVPRSGSGKASFGLNGRQYFAAGRICMDQFVLDVGDDRVEPGDLVYVFGPGDHGEPSVREFATACGTIANEVLTGIGRRVAHTFVS
jgi:alanine racemase